MLKSFRYWWSAFWLVGFRVSIDKFLQNQASQADHSANVDVHSETTRLFVRQLLGDAEYAWDPEDGQKAVLHLNSSTPRSNAHLVYASEVVLRFRLLDIYTEALGVSTNEKRIVMPRMERPTCGTRRMEQVRFSFTSLFSHLLLVSFTNNFKTGINYFSISMNSIVNTSCTKCFKIMLRMQIRLPVLNSSNSFPAFYVYVVSDNIETPWSIARSRQISWR